MHKSNSKLTKERLTKMYAEKQMSPAQIATKLGASTSGVAQALKRFGFELRGSADAARLRHHTESLPWEKIKAEYVAGATSDELSKKYNVVNTTILSNLRRLGITVRPKGLPKGVSSGALIQFDVDAAIKMNKAGKTLTEIAEELGISYGTLQYRLRSVGYSPRRDLRSKSEISRNYQFHKRKVLEALDTEACMVCGETRCIDLAHIAPKKDGHKLVPVNTVALCPTHHRLFDTGKLSKPEVKKLLPRLTIAAQNGFMNKHWSIS